MAENYFKSRSTFEWNIYDPFLPEQSYEAKFCHGSGSSNVKPWKVTLESMDRRTNYWAFMVCLDFLEGFERRCETVADTVKVSVDLNGKQIAEKEDAKFLFCISNQFKFYLDGIAHIPPKREPHHFVIRVDISLRGRDVKNEGLFPKDLSLRMLSNDLKSLLKDPKYTDMTLWSSNPRRDFPVHSCIVDVRWGNFSEKHPLVGNKWKHIETRISASLLLDILTFLYSGICSVNWPYWKEAAYASELFQVIDWYGMNHLHKTFLKNELEQVRVTKSPVVIDSRVFPLGVDGGRPVSNASYTWNVDFKPECEIVLHLRVGNEAGNWLSYSLQSKSESKVYVDVNFRLERRVEGEGTSHLTFHEQHFSIDPKATVKPRCALFLDCPETFGDFISPASQENEAKFFICCFLRITDGTTVDQVTIVGGDRMGVASELLCVLSNDMRKVRKRMLHTDMRVLSTPGFFDGMVLAEEVHRAIFAARVPQWWAGLENAPQKNGIPETATSNLSIDTLPSVLDYIYTGKPNVIFDISHAFVEEVEDFASKTLFNALHDLAICIPSGKFYKKGA